MHCERFLFGTYSDPDSKVCRWLNETTNSVGLLVQGNSLGSGPAAGSSCAALGLSGATVYKTMCVYIYI